MNKDNAAQYLPLVQALAKGKTIQGNYSGFWMDENELLFKYPPEQYRIKREPVNQ